MQNNEEQSIEENLPMVNYIMLHRIYDMLTVIANKIVGSDEINKMVEYHESGYLLGPAPSYNAGIDENEEKNG